jgi:transcription elongation factor Elf1/glutaredoxin
MKEDDARELRHELSQEIGSGWGVQHAEKDVSEVRRRVNWTVTVVQKNNLSREFRLPQSLSEFVDDYDLWVDVDASDRRAKITLDNKEYNELELTEAEKEREELEAAIRSEFDLNRDGVEALADEYDSIDEILAASREELTSVKGISDRRANKILHRHSSKLAKRMRETSDSRTIPVIEDEDGVLRLPEELEDSD